MREAAGFEGLIVLGVIYFILSRLQRAGRKAKEGGAVPVPPPPSAGGTGTREEGLSLETILREIERVKQQQQRPQAPAQAQRVPAPARPQGPPSRRSVPARRPELVQDQRGPLGRRPDAALPSAEDDEEAVSLDELRVRGEAVPLGLTEAERRKRERQVVDEDEQAEAVAQRRFREAEARNRPHAAADHRAFDQRIRAEGAASAPATTRAEQLRQAVIWREILGPPKALDG
jgi:hypothetical protein